MEILIIRSIRYFFELLNLLIFARVIMSWFPRNGYNKFIDILNQLTDPILEPFRKLSERFGLNAGMMDLSPIIALLFLQFIAEPVIINVVSILL